MYSSLHRRPSHQAQLTALLGTKISSSDPTLTSVLASDTSKPLAPLCHLPVERPPGRPRCSLHFDGRVHFSAIGFGILSRGARSCIPDSNTDSVLIKEDHAVNLLTHRDPQRVDGTWAGSRGRGAV